MDEVLALLNVEEAARRYGLSRSKLYELIAKREVPSVRLGGRIRVPVAQMEALLAAKVNQTQ